MGHLSASSANALPPNVTGMFRSTSADDVKHEPAGSPHKGVKHEPDGPPTACVHAGAQLVATNAPHDDVGDLDKPRTETIAKFKAAGVDIKAAGAEIIDGGVAEGVMKRPSAMKRPSTASHVIKSDQQLAALGSTKWRSQRLVANTVSTSLRMASDSTRGLPLPDMGSQHDRIWVVIRIESVTCAIAWSGNIIIMANRISW